MRPLNTVIIEKSYIIGKGLKKILEESGNFNVIDIALNNHQLENILSHHNIDIIYINNDLTNEFINLISQNNEINLISIINNTDHKLSDLFFDSINIFDDRNNVILKIEDIYKKLKTNKESTSVELSKRERTILKYVALGYTTKEIAEELFLSPHTVVTHRKNISNRLGIKTVSGLTIYAVLNNIIDLSEAK